MHVEQRDERRRAGGLSGSWSDKNREGQEMRGMKRREGREYEGGNEQEMKEKNLRKFFFYSNVSRPRTCFISKKQRMMNRGQNEQAT